MLNRSLIIYNSCRARGATSPLRRSSECSVVYGAERRGSFYIQRPRHDGGQSEMQRQRNGAEGVRLIKY